MIPEYDVPQGWRCGGMDFTHFTVSSKISDPNKLFQIST